MALFNLKFQSKWIEKNIDDEFMDYVDKLGLFLCDKDHESANLGYNAITVTQLRNIFSEVKRIEQKMENPSDFPGLKEEEEKQIAIKAAWYSDFLMLRAKLAYSTGRVLEKNRNSNMKKFSEIMVDAMKSVKEPNHFDNFVKFFEAVIAFHKVYGGKDNDKKG
jgi:CRISPR-associated protein Csm2